MNGGDESDGSSLPHAGPHADKAITLATVAGASGVHARIRAAAKVRNVDDPPAQARTSPRWCTQYSTE